MPARCCLCVLLRVRLLLCPSAVCDGLPPAELLKGLGTWSESCRDKTYWGSVCTGTCQEFGTASIKCGGYEWMLDTFKGGCSSTAGAAVLVYFGLTWLRYWNVCVWVLG